MEHEVFVPSPPGAIREALRDPARVARAIHGFRAEVTDGPPHTLAGRLRFRVGGSTITYRGTVRLVERGPDATAEGRAAEARGSGLVTFEVAVVPGPAEGGSVLRFTGTAAVSGGRLAEQDADLAAAAARRLLDRFAAELAAGLPDVGPAAVAAVDTAATFDTADGADTAVIADSADTADTAADGAEPPGPTADEPAARPEAAPDTAAAPYAEAGPYAEAEAGAEPARASGAGPEPDAGEPPVRPASGGPDSGTAGPDRRSASERGADASGSGEPEVDQSGSGEPGAGGPQGGEPEADRGGSDEPEAGRRQGGEPGADLSGPGEPGVDRSGSGEPEAGGPQGGEAEAADGAPGGTGASRAEEPDDAGPVRGGRADRLGEDAERGPDGGAAASAELPEGLTVPESAAELDPLPDDLAEEDGKQPAEAAHARRTMIGRSAEEVDHAPPRGRYAPVPAPAAASGRYPLRWAAPAAAALVASAIVVGRVLRRRR